MWGLNRLLGGGGVCAWVSGICGGRCFSSSKAKKQEASLPAFTQGTHVGEGARGSRHPVSCYQ